MRIRANPRPGFGDFQTPPQLARDVCSLLARKGLAPASILEPTCGQGNFLAAALRSFPTVRKAIGIDINPNHVAYAQNALTAESWRGELDLRHEDFFMVDWRRLLDSLPEPALVIGNPPWVTNAALGAIGSSNLPKKSNFQNLRGIDAVTGKGNFDISEWMLLQMLDWIAGKRGTIAMLCKTSVARKVLTYAWQQQRRSNVQVAIYGIDAAAYFGAAVDACLLVIVDSATPQPLNCPVYDSLAADSPSASLGYANGRLLADSAAYAAWQHLEGTGTVKWRSGIKHDSARVMELRAMDGRYGNALGEVVQLEDVYLYPMLKSSDLARSDNPAPTRYMLVPQRFVGEPTHLIQAHAPLTWRYLVSHAEHLDRRASSIYRGRPRFSIFGVGEYTFAPWKVAVSGFYRSLRFRVIGPVSGKPVVFDDTCYFAAFASRAGAVEAAALLNSPAAQEFFSAFIFPDAKRPVTATLLERLDLHTLAQELGRDVPTERYQPALI